MLRRIFNQQARVIQPLRKPLFIMPKRKASAAAAPAVESTPKPKRSRKSTNPTINPDVLDGAEALRASPDASPDDSAPVKTTPATQFLAEESDQDDSPEEIQKALSRPPPVNSDYLPLPWKGRIGYACLCTYLRFSNPPVFSSRTCRIASILENRHPLANPDEPPHATKNRPDKEQPADVARGQAYVESLGLANARDIIKMIRWNDRYGIKFMRLSSEMFPFASHEEYGYKLDFAADVLGEAGKLIAKLGHRVTTHPGQVSYSIFIIPRELY
jgi:UV DNA damage endonuclease